MKKSLFILLLCLVIGMASSLWGGTLGDVNDDGIVGLPETIYSLQVTSGIRTPSSAPSIPGVDMAEYFYVANGSYLYRVTNPAILGSTTLTYRCVSKMVDGANMLAIQIDGMNEDYYAIGPSGIAFSGTSSLSPTSPATQMFVPPRQRGTRDMAKGDLFTNFYHYVSSPTPATSPPLLYEEVLFVGFEDVTVPAGTFQKCLKFLRRDSSGTRVIFFARNIGMVKAIISNSLTQPATPSGSITELTSAQIGNTTYGNMMCFGSGTWAQTIDDVPSGAGNFSLPIFTQNGKASGQITLPFYYSGISPLPISIISDDFIHFSADPAVYGVNPPELSITVSNGTVFGYFIEPVVATHHGVSEPVTPPVIRTTLTGICSGS